MLAQMATHAQKALDNAPVLTYSGSTTALFFWGLHLSDIGVIVSSVASVCGVGLQFYVAISRARASRRQQETDNDVEGL